MKKEPAGKPGKGGVGGVERRERTGNSLLVSPFCSFPRSMCCTDNFFPREEVCIYPFQRTVVERGAKSTSFTRGAIYSEDGTLWPSLNDHIGSYSSAAYNYLADYFTVIAQNCTEEFIEIERSNFFFFLMLASTGRTGRWPSLARLNLLTIYIRTRSSGTMYALYVVVSSWFNFISVLYFYYDCYNNRIAGSKNTFCYFYHL